MNRIARKLHSKTGASMLIALLFLLVALTVGAVVLTAASAAAGRTARNLKEQQNYLAVASAVELIKADMEKAEFSGKYAVTSGTRYYSVPDPDAEEEGATKTETAPFGPEYSSVETVFPRSKILQQASSPNKLENTCYGSTGYPGYTVPGDITCTISFDAAHNMPVVTGTFIMTTQESGRYNIMITLSTVDKTNLTTLLFEANVNTEILDSGFEEQRANGLCIGTTTTYTTTVTWGAPVIYKGAAT